MSESPTFFSIFNHLIVWSLFYIKEMIFKLKIQETYYNT